MSGIVVAEQGGRSGLLGPLEAEVMAVFWHAGRPVPVREVADAVNAGRGSPLAYTTILTVMTRLARKKILVRSRIGREYLYTPVAAGTADIAARGVLDEYGACHHGGQTLSRTRRGGAVLDLTGGTVVRLPWAGLLRWRLTILVAAVALGLLVASCSPGAPAASNSSQHGVITLNHISTLKALFNKDNGQPRLVLILSPT